jgi:hypothetical protein
LSTCGESRIRLKESEYNLGNEDVKKKKSTVSYERGLTSVFDSIIELNCTF